MIVSWKDGSDVRCRPGRHAVVPPELEQLEYVFARVGEALEDAPSGDDSVWLFPGDSYVLAVSDFLDASKDSIPFQRSNYYQVIAMHPGLHPVLHAHVDAYLERIGHVAESLDDFRNLVAVGYGVENPFGRPLPLGVSLGVRSGLGPDASVLCVRRSQQVALNPGVLTTCVDEGVVEIGDFPLVVLREGIKSELGFLDLEQDLGATFSQHSFLGIAWPDPAEPEPQCCVSGANALYDLCVPEQLLSRLLARTRLAVDTVGHPEIQEFELLTASDVLSRTDISHPLLEYCSWVVSQ